MKSVLVSCVFAVVALSVAGAPVFEGDQQQYVSQQQMEEFLRERRAPYSSYVPPCASAGAVQVPISSVPVAAFAAPSYQGYAAIPQYPYSGPHYRSVDEQSEAELMGFSDMDQLMQGHVPMARLGGYGAAGIAGVSPALSGGGGHVFTQATSGTALGVFPNANVGGCSVPLLFSCSPSIASGHIVEPQAHVLPTYAAASGAAASSNSYRLVDEPSQHEHHSQHDEQLTHEQLSNEPSHTSHKRELESIA